MADSTPPSNHTVPAEAPGIPPLFPDGEAELARLRAGDREAFDAFFECWFPKVLGWTRKHVTANADARLVTDAALMRALSELASRPPELPFAHWMLRIARSELDRITH